MQLENKIAIITGASSGIGEAAARLFAREGAKLVLAARREDRLNRLAEEIRNHGGEAVSVPGDITSPAFAGTLVGTAQREFGGLDIAFNNAGMMGDMAPVADMDAKNWRQVMETNLDSAFLAAKAQLPAMKARGGGSIIFTGSFVGHTIGMPGMGAYAASKAGLVGLTQVLASEHGAERIRVNALLPGGTKTAMAPGDPETQAFIAGLHALKRMAEPEEIARVALFLASDQSEFVTGSALLADGGNSVCKT